jgi:hypothetical protein
MTIKLNDIPDPIGKWLLDNTNKSFSTESGSYYHYVEVCRLLQLMKEQCERKVSSDESGDNKNVKTYCIKQNLNIFDFGNMTIKVNEDGFSIWMVEMCDDGELSKRWVIDGSNVKRNARIDLNNKEGREFRSVYIEDENCVEIQRS